MNWRSLTKRWILSLSLVILLITLTVCRSLEPPIAAPPAASPAASPSPSLSPAPVAQTSFPPAQVDAERLFQHVQALNFERFTDPDRTRARQYLAQTLTTLGWQPQIQRFEGGVNLVAERAGTDASAGSILITAHYDTVPGSPGADDNASAVAAALEIARLLGSRPTFRTLKLAFFDQEEAGLQGSLAFTANSTNLTNLLGVVNLEMMGYACYTAGCQKYPDGLPISPPNDRGDFLGVIVDQEHSFLLSAFQTSRRSTLPPVITLPVPLKGLLTPDLLRSDHAPFWAKNIGAVMVADTANFRNPYYHQSTDTPDTLDRSFLTGSAQIVLDAVNSLLNNQAFQALENTQ